MKKYALLIKHIEHLFRGFVPVPSLVEVEGNFLEFAYDKLECQTVDVVRIDRNIDIWVDDEGLFANDDLVFEYKLDNWLDSPVTLAGNLLITKGADSEGNTVFFQKRDLDLLSEIAANIQTKSKFIGRVEV